MATIELQDGTPLYYETAGWENAGPPIIFLNGMSQSTSHWGTHVHYFEKQNRVITYNARGQGAQPTGEVELTLQQHCEDLHELLEHLYIKKARLVGFSHGARVALGYASFYPEDVAKLVLVSATAKMTVRAKLVVESWLQALELGGLEAMVWVSLPMILSNAYLEKHERMIPGIVKASLNRNSKEGMLDVLKSMQKFPVLETLVNSVEAPTLLLAGSEDPLVDKPGAERLAKLLDARLEYLKGVGHTIPIEVPDEFQQLVEEFLSDENSVF